MTNQRPRGLFGRLNSLIRGIFTVWVRDRETENPQAVYEQAIGERTKQYRDLKQAVAGILYMRNKIEAELSERRAELARTHDDIKRAVTRGDDQVALVLVARKQALTQEVTRNEAELQGVRNQADEAKGNLAHFREEIRGLEREKVRALATLASAGMRRRVQEALEGLSVESDLRALETVREHVAHAMSEGRLEQEIEDESLQARIQEIRQEAAGEAAREELADIKNRLGMDAKPVLPVSEKTQEPEAVAVAH